MGSTLSQALPPLRFTVICWFSFPHLSPQRTPFQTSFPYAASFCEIFLSDFPRIPLSLLPTRPLLWGKKFDPLQPQFGEILMSPWLLFAELPPFPPSPRPWDEQCPHTQSLVQVFGRVKPRTFQGKDCVWFQFVDNPLESSSLQILTRNASVEVHLVSLNKLIQLIRKSYPTTIIYY